MTTLKNFPTEVTSGANGGSHTSASAASGLADMAQATALKILFGSDQDDIRDGLAGVLVFIGVLCHTMDIDMQKLLNHAAKTIAEIEERDAEEKAAGVTDEEATLTEADFDALLQALGAIIEEAQAEGQQYTDGAVPEGVTA